MKKKYFNKKQHRLDYFEIFYVDRGVRNKERNIFERWGFLVCSQAKPRPPLNGHFFKVKILGQNPTRRKSFFTTLTSRNNPIRHFFKVPNVGQNIV